MIQKIKEIGRFIKLDNSLFDALNQMNGDVRLLFVFDEKDNFQGLLSIGDIQRAIINKIDLTEKIYTVLRPDFSYAKDVDDFSFLKERMRNERIEAMPILNVDNKLIDIVLWSDLYSIKENINRKLHLPVVIMAGGMGTRLQPLTNVIPKPLIPLGDKSIIETIMDQFASYACRDFYISVNFKYEMMEYYLSNISSDYNIKFLKETKPLGTIGSASLLKGRLNSTVIISNCDILIEQDYSEVFDYHIENKNEITIIAALKDFQIPYGVIKTGPKGILKDLEEKPNLIYQINTGVYLIEPNVIDEIPEDTYFHMTHLIDKVRARGGKIGVFPVSNKSWTDIGTLEEYYSYILHHRSEK